VHDASCVQKAFYVRIGASIRRPSVGMKVLCQAWFAAWFLTCMSLAGALIKLVSVLGLSKKRSEGIAIAFVQAAWRTTMGFTPWMRFTASRGWDEEWANILAMMEASDVESKHKPWMFLSNHTSFMDVLLFTTLTRTSVMWKCRTYMDHALFKMPILSTICRGCGHFPVYFKSTEEGKFTVDKEKNAEVDKLVDAHLSTGNLCFFPEGQVNKDPDNIMSFRFGGMKKALDFDARLVLFVAAGNPNVWPKKAKFGGVPGRVNYGIKLMAPDGAKAYVAQLRSRDDLTTEDKAMADYELMAKYLRLAMQQYYDELKAGADDSKAKYD